MNKTNKIGIALSYTHVTFINVISPNIFLLEVYLDKSTIRSYFLFIPSTLSIFQDI